MAKTKKELDEIAKEISSQYGRFLNVKEVGEVLGVSRETARKITSEMEPATVCGIKKFYVRDVVEKIFN